jgi:Tfp pilus assembly protein PilF
MLARERGHPRSWSRAASALYFTKAIGLDAAYVDGYTQRALAYLKLGRTAECRADFEKVLLLAPEGPQAGLARKALAQLP